MTLTENEIRKLPDFGETLTFQGLINEKRTITNDITALQQREREIDAEIFALVTTNWTPEEIATVRNGGQ